MSSETKAEGMGHIEDKLDERGVAPTESTTSTSTNDGTMMGTIKSYLGYGGDGSTDASASTTLPDRTREPTSDKRANEDVFHSTPDTSFDGARNNTKGAHPEKLASTQANKNFESTGASSHAAGENLAATEANKSFESTGPSSYAAGENLAATEANKSFDITGNSAQVADPSKDTSMKGTEPTPAGSANEKPAASEEGTSAPTGGSSAVSKGLEHPDAIPTAGGEKLGKKHWGESKVVPETPKPVEEEAAGVSSKAGQPTSEVSDNTSKNTGGATSGPHGQSSGSATTGAGKDGAEKESVADKIKDKLHIGKK